MMIIDSLLSFLAPHLCVACGVEGGSLCDRCAETAGERMPERCAGCRKLSSGNTTCKSCRSWLRADAVHVATSYEGVYEGLVKLLKFDCHRDAAKSIAEIMHKGGSRNGEWIICPLPTAPSRIRQRGLDHTKLIAKHYSRLQGLPSNDFLIRLGNTRQVGASRQERLNQLEDEFYAPPGSCKGVKILLLDDLVTTGASISSATRALKQAGAKRVEAVVFAQKM